MYDFIIYLVYTLSNRTDRAWEKTPPNGKFTSYHNLSHLVCHKTSIETISLDIDKQGVGIRIMGLV